MEIAGPVGVEAQDGVYHQQPIEQQPCGCPHLLLGGFRKQ